MSDFFGPRDAAMTDFEPRCWRCGRMLARVLTQPWHIDCPKCKATNRRGNVPELPAVVTPKLGRRSYGGTEVSTGSVSPGQ